MAIVSIPLGGLSVLGGGFVAITPAIRPRFRLLRWRLWTEEQTQALRVRLYYNTQSPVDAAGARGNELNAWFGIPSNDNAFVRGGVSPREQTLDFDLDFPQGGYLGIYVDGPSAQADSVLTVEV